MKDNDSRSHPHGKRLSAAPSTMLSVNRRKVVKSAMITAPVILTLKSGAAAAFASAEQCIAQNAKLAGEENPEPFLKEDEETDVWVRKQTTCRELKPLGDKASLTPGGDEFWVYQDPDNREQWRRMDNPVEIYVDASLTFDSNDDDDSDDDDRFSRMTLAGTNTLFKVNEEKSCQILVLYDDYGNIAGYGAPSFANVGSPITASCWASIDPDLANLP